jgi:hypothetical protein
VDEETPDNTALEAEIEQVRSLGVEGLRQRWRRMVGANPPKGLTKDIVARMITYRIQCEAFGGLDRQTIKLLDRLARGNKPDGLNRRLKTGTVLLREYQGERHTVTVVPDGFLWQDSTYPSLSVIARAITGTAWNGPRFFGLRASAGHRASANTTLPSLPRAVKTAKEGRSAIQPSGAGGRRRGSGHG